MSVGGERDLRVRIGSMISPDHFWLIPYRKSEQLVQLERELAECFSSSSSFGQGMVPSVEEVVPEAIVALTVDFKVWKRAKVVTKIARFLSGSQVVSDRR